MPARGQTRAGSLTSALTLAFFLLVSIRARAGDVKIIANPGVKVDTISFSEIKRIFLLEANSLDDGTHVEPVLHRGGPVQDAFLREFLDTDVDSLRSYYGTLVFTGKASMPKQLGSDTEIVSYVARTKGAIGYVSAETQAEGVKNLEIVNSGATTERTLIRQVAPAYPATLKEKNISGIVRLKVTVAANGSVENIKLLGGNPILAESAIAAVKQWTYSSGHSRTTIAVNVSFGANP
jgi:TonB family protein